MNGKKSGTCIFLHNNNNKKKKPIFMFLFLNRHLVPLAVLCETLQSRVGPVRALPGPLWFQVLRAAESIATRDSGG